MQHLLCILLHLGFGTALHQIGSHIVAFTMKSRQIFWLKLLQFLVIKGLHQIHDIIRHSHGSIHRNLDKINVHITDNIII